MKKLTLFSALMLMMMPALAQQQFSTPDIAADALVNAISTQDDTALGEILGDDWRHYLPSEGVDPQAVARFLRDWKVSHHIEQQGNTAHLNVGEENWQLPLPLQKSAEGWHFDMTAAADEILTRTIGRNELGAMQAMQAWVAAEHDYYQINQRWAKKIISSEGQKDGLYWPTAPGETPSPLGPAFSPVTPGEGYHGYRFRIIAGADDQSVALLAWPVEWGKTGVMSFMIDTHGALYQADSGEDTPDKAQTIERYAPDENWQSVKQ